MHVCHDPQSNGPHTSNAADPVITTYVGVEVQGHSGSSKHAGNTAAISE